MYCGLEINEEERISLEYYDVYNIMVCLHNKDTSGLRVVFAGAMDMEGYSNFMRYGQFITCKKAVDNAAKEFRRENGIDVSDDAKATAMLLVHKYKDGRMHPVIEPSEQAKMDFLDKLVCVRDAKVDDEEEEEQAQAQVLQQQPPFLFDRDDFMRRVIALTEERECRKTRDDPPSPPSPSSSSSEDEEEDDE